MFNGHRGCSLTRKRTCNCGFATSDYINLTGAREAMHHEILAVKSPSLIVSIHSSSAAYSSTQIRNGQLRCSPVLPKQLPQAGEVNITPCFVWCRLRDSNPRPSDYKSDALPAELSRPRWNGCHYFDQRGGASGSSSHFFVSRKGSRFLSNSPTLPHSPREPHISASNWGYPILNETTHQDVAWMGVR